MSAPKRHPWYSRLPGDLVLGICKRVKSRATRAQRRKRVMLLQAGLLALLFGHFTGVSARPEGAMFFVGGNPVARAGQGTYLFCNGEDTADPPSSYVWVKDGKVTPGQTRHVLTLSSVTRQDAGYYQCGSPNSSSYGKGVYLHVFVPGDKLPRPLLEPKEWPVVGRPFSLHCYFLEGYITSPDTTYTWYKNSTEIQGQRGDFLRFSNLTEADRGEYTCTAREGAAETTSLPSSEVDVRPWVPPQVQMKPPGPLVKGVRGENLILTCEVTRALPGVPVDGYSWSYRAFPNGPQRPLLVNTSTLTLSPLTLEDRGQYVCQARNDQLYPGSNINLTGQAFDTVDIVYLDNLTLTPDHEVSEGDYVTLTCAVDSLPTAQLAWTVRGQEIRHVTDNLDHYVISRAACSDSGSYTCAASNTELPGRHRHATLQLLVHCRTVPTSDVDKTEVGAIFYFPHPDWTSMVVVHPGGHDVISVRQDCSYNVSSAFQSRCLQPRCDPIRHRLSFTLTNVTEEDEGEYVCLEEGLQRTPIHNCSMRMRLGKFLLHESLSEPSRLVEVTLTVFLLGLLCGFLPGIVLGTWRHNFFQNVWMRLGKTAAAAKKLISRMSSAGQRQVQVRSTPLTFENCFQNAEVYIFPRLVPPETPLDTFAGTGERSSTPLLQQNLKTRKSRAEYQVKSLLRSVLMHLKMTGVDEMPSFLLHNTRLGKQESVILVLSKTLGVVVLAVSTATGPGDQQEAEETARRLVEARDTVRQNLQGIVSPETVRHVLCLPCLSHNEDAYLPEALRILLSDPMSVLCGQEQEYFRQNLMAGQSGNLWKPTCPEETPDSMYKEVARRFLSLASDDCLKQSSNDSESMEPLLLTPAQMEVRDSTARLLHIWGPPGSGKTTLLVHRARQWLAENKVVILAIGGEFYDIQLAQIERSVQKGLEQEAKQRIRICRTDHEIDRAVKHLGGTYPNVDKCVIIDMIRNYSLLETLLPDVISGNINGIWSTARENLNPTVKEKLRRIDWESFNLPECIRCTDNTVELLNKLGHRVFPPIPSCKAPCQQNIPAWRVVDHSLHPDHVATKTKCSHCKTEMSAALPAMMQADFWKNWIALHTGDPNIFVNSDDVFEAAKTLDVPVTYEDIYLRHETTMATSASHQDKSTPDFVNFRKQIIDGVDKREKPTLHLIRVEEFEGMEREGVILVHWDFRDNNPDCQSQEERATRLQEHRQQWIQAASRSTGQVLLLLLSPSPARSLLDLPEVPLPE